MSPKAKQDVIVSVVLYAAIGFFLGVTGTMLPDSALFPRMVLILMAIINTINVITVVTKDREARKSGITEKSMLTFQEAKMPLVVFLGTVLYTVVFVFTNYFIATALMLIIFMLIEKVKPKWMIIAITVVYLAFIYYLFVVQLAVRLIR